MNDLQNIAELEEYNFDNNNINNSFTFDDIYSNYEELDIKNNIEKNHNNYDLEPENRDIKRIELKVKDIPRLEPNIENIRIQQTIPKKNAKVIKPQVVKEEPKITYDDILDRMGMYVLNGELHLKENSNSRQNISNENINTNQYFHNNNNNNTYSYIHNKYFKDYVKTEEQQINFENSIEYRNYLIKQIIHNYRLKKQIKPKKIYIPSEFSFNISPNEQISDLNKLFNFSKR